MRSTFEHSRACLSRAGPLLLYGLLRLHRLLYGSLLEHMSAHQSVNGSGDGLQLQCFEEQDQVRNGPPEADDVVDDIHAAVETAGQRDGICLEYVDQGYHKVCNVGNKINEYIDQAEEQSKSQCSDSRPPEPRIFFSDQYVTKQQNGRNISAYQSEGIDACRGQPDGQLGADRSGDEPKGLFYRFLAEKQGELREMQHTCNKRC